MKLLCKILLNELRSLQCCEDEENVEGDSWERAEPEVGKKKEKGSKYVAGKKVNAPGNEHGKLSTRHVGRKSAGDSRPGRG